MSNLIVKRGRDNRLVFPDDIQDKCSGVLIMFSDDIDPRPVLRALAELEPLKESEPTVGHIYVYEDRDVLEKFFKEE